MGTINYNKIGNKLEKLQAKEANKKSCIDGAQSHRKNKYGKCSDCGRVFAVSFPHSSE